MNMIDGIYIVILQLFQTLFQPTHFYLLSISADLFAMDFKVDYISFDVTNLNKDQITFNLIDCLDY